MLLLWIQLAIYGLLWAVRVEAARGTAARRFGLGRWQLGIQHVVVGLREMAAEDTGRRLDTWGRT